MLLKILSALLLFIQCGFLLAQKQKYYSLSTEEGIISNHIDYTYVDSFGFLWIATYDGLQRWDGVNGHIYTADEKKSSTLASNICYTITEDSEQNIWIGTIKGLCRFNRNTGTITRVDVGKNNSPVNAILPQKGNMLWVGTSNGLCLLNTKTLKFSQPVQVLKDLPVFALDADQINRLWVGTFEGLYAVNMNTNAYTHFEAKDQQSILSNKVRALHCDTKGNIWAGTFDNGLSVLNPAGKILYQLHKFGHTEHPKGGFDEIRAIHEDKDQQIWIGIVNQPLYKFDTATHNLLPQSIYSENHAGKNAEGVFSISEDQFGNMWLGTHGMGLFYTNRFKNKIGHVGGKAHLSISSAQNIVTSIVVDQQGNEWAGTDGNGLLKTNRQGKTKTFTVKNGLTSNAIHHVSIDTKGLLWLSTWGGGVMSMNPLTEQVTSYVHSKNPFSFIGNNSKVILPDDSLVWIGTHGDGLAILDRASGKIYHQLNNNKFPFDLKEPAWINHIFKDSRKRIWVSTCFGLYMVKNNKLHSFHISDKSAHLANDYVNMVAENKGKIWIIGEGGGLQWLDEKSQSFVQISNKEIPSTIKSIVFDPEGTIWLGTNIGLISYQPETAKLHLYNRNNGFQSNHFFHKASYCSAEGVLYEGGINGYNRFKPQDLAIHTQKLRLVFENALLQGDAPDTLLNITNQLTIPYLYKVSSVYFSVPDQHSSSNLKIEYRLEGLHTHWIPLAAGVRTISLTGLSPDNYQLNLRYNVEGNEWLTFPNKLMINVLPPWWKTLWFRSLLFLLAITSVYLVYYIRTASIRKRNILLKELVTERTAALQETNVALLEKNDETMIQYEQLEQLNLKYKKQAHTIIQHQNTILAQNRDLNRIIEHASLQDNGEIKELLSSLSETENTDPQQELPVKIALYKIPKQHELETSLAAMALIANCQNEEGLLNYLPDFILIDEHFDGTINALVSHIPIIRIIGSDALIRAPHIIADMTVAAENITTALPKQIRQYISRRKLINERFARNEALTNDELTPHSADKEFIDQTIAIIEHHLSNSAFDNELLGAELHLSRTVLYSKIKQLTGMGVHEYIKMIRVKKSIDLLKERKLNVSQIAYEVGFSSPSYYIRCFVKQFGMPPKEYMSQKR